MILQQIIVREVDTPKVHIPLNLPYGNFTYKLTDINVGINSHLLIVRTIGFVDDVSTKLFKLNLGLVLQSFQIVEHGKAE